MKFDEGLPDHFIIFSQTPKAQDFSRRIFLQFGIALLLPILGIVIGGASFLGAFFLVMLVAIMILGFRQWRRWQRIPFAVNPSHPMMELDSTKQAEVMIRLHHGRWVKAGKDRYRLINDDLLQGFNLVALDDEYTILGYLTEEKVLNSNLRRIMSLLNQSLALRDAHNEVGDDIEDARLRESLDYGLLDRDWPEEIEIEDAAGPIAKKLRGQE
tara:strand:- start:439 stop:1077 length:639 start_codon:yes stop_codon:yes gene_type:complete